MEEEEREKERQRDRETEREGGREEEGKRWMRKRTNASEQQGKWQVRRTIDGEERMNESSDVGGGRQKKDEWTNQCKKWNENPRRNLSQKRQEFSAIATLIGGNVPGHDADQQWILRISDR